MHTGLLPNVFVPVHCQLLQENVVQIAVLKIAHERLHGERACAIHQRD